MPVTSLILDVDTGVDDALAILYAAGTPDVELVACTGVMGNVTVDQAVENTLTVLELAGLAEVEVARGAERPLVHDHEPFPIVHGERGLGRSDLPPPSGTPSARSAVRLIVDTARARPGEILLVATGPLTNIAAALTDEPRLPDLLRGFAIMGGAFDQAGNVTPPAEANIWVDPEAAEVVFRAFSGAEPAKLPVCVGLDVTERVRMTREDIAAVCAPAPSSQLARFLQDAVTFYIEFSERTGAEVGASMHDPLALAIALDESLATLVATRVEVETSGRWTTGMTVADLRGLRHEPWNEGWDPTDNARVAVDVDERAFLDRFFRRLSDLVAERAGVAP